MNPVVIVVCNDIVVLYVCIVQLYVNAGVLFCIIICWLQTDKYNFTPDKTLVSFTK